jgi:adenosylhomocysteine nucleosidase
MEMENVRCVLTMPMVSFWPMRVTTPLAFALLAATFLTGCGAREQARRPMLIEGAMPAEVERLAGRLEHGSMETVGGWTVWLGAIEGYPVVVLKTGKGAANTAAATAIAVERYHPVAIVNLGTAGGHDPALHVFDIVVGQESVNLGAFKTAYRERGRGSNSLEWSPMDLQASEGSAGQDAKALTMRRFAGDAGLLAAARGAAHLYTKGRIVEGVIGSGEVWNSELDRIEWFHRQFGTSAEEMETASAAQIAARMATPFLGIRILSNNIANGGAYDGNTAGACQDFVYEVVKTYAAGLRSQ